ncbi:hypothetical protein QJS10_CPB13g01108 [Acorus calamus]|uniref:Uncharacterized protein n=1 Tax=Acorus calamus TaxID=4465 RepID=A0AAV9DIG3_ACOCL|nr:hypothetical protein QJS10_CPB13g01108 [Acorus calamus]
MSENRGRSSLRHILVAFISILLHSHQVPNTLQDLSLLQVRSFWLSKKQSSSMSANPVRDLHVML